MKSKKKLLLGTLVLSLILVTSVQYAVSYFIIDPPPSSTVYLKWYSRPSDKTVDAETSVSATWKAKSSFSGKGYIIKKNGLTVKSGSWSSYRAITYTYTPTLAGTDELECKVYDSQKTLYDYCYITVIAPDADGDGISDARELAIGTDPYDPNDPLGQHFEDQSAGENPNGWEVQEFAGYSDIRIADSSSLGLINPNPGNLLKITQNEYGAAPSIYKLISNGLSSPLLVSFEAGFYSQYDDWSDTGYLELVANGIILLKLEFKHDRVCIWESPISCKNVDLTFNEKQIYKYNLILQNDAGGHVDYSLYIEGACFAFGTVDYATKLQAILFGVSSYYYSEFYIDNIYCNTVELADIEYDIPIPLAIPLCWLYAPEVEGVQSQYQVGRTTSVEISIALTVGIPLYKGIELVGGIDIVSWYIELSDTYYGILLDSSCQDVIMHIKLDYSISKMSIVLPGTSEVLMDVLIDCNYHGSKYYDLTADDFETAYGWRPIDPRINGITKVGSHTETYDQNGSVMKYKSYNGLTILTYSGGIKVGKGLFIGVEATYSDKVYAEICLWVDRLIQPQFDYGRPNNHDAYLGIQPYIVKPFGTM